MSDSRSWTDIGGWSTGGALYWMGRQMRKQEKAQEAAVERESQAMKQAEANAMRQERMAQENINKANRKRPDQAKIAAAATADATRGAAGTMLTGYNPLGGGPAANRTTLLGG